MARLFDDTQNEYLKIEQAVKAGVPLVAACFFNSNDATNHQTLFFLGDKDVTAQFFELLANSSQQVQVNAVSASAGVALSTTTWNLDTWHHACAIWTSSTDRRAFLDGGGKGTDATNITPANLDRTSIGYRGSSSPSYYMSGRIAEMAVWDLSQWPGATDSDKADNFEKILPSLAKGFSPRCFPLGLVAYWPLIRTEDDDIVGSYNMSAYNTPSVGSHCPIILPRKVQVTVPSGISYTATPSTLAAQAILHAPTVVIDCTVTPSPLTAVAYLWAFTLSFDYTVTPAALSGIATLQTPVTVHIQYPGSLSALATLHASTILIDCIVTPTTLATEATLHAPTITGVSDCTVTPSTLGALVTLHVPTIKVFYTAIPSFMLADLIAPYSGGAWLWLIEVIVPGYDTVRLARNTEDVFYGTHNFPKSSFAVNKQVLSGDGTIPRLALRIAQDETHNLEAIMNATKGMGNGSVKIIRTCEKFSDTPVQDFEAIYGILTAGSDSEWIALSLGIPNPLTQKIPRDLYSSSICPLATPSLFKGVKCRYTGEDTTCTGLFEDCRTKGNAQHWGAELGLDPSSIRV